MKWKKTAALLVLSIITFCSVPAALAYRTDHAQAVNAISFVGEKGLNAILTEPSWKPERGLLVLPNSTIPKDPQVTNTSSSNLDELVALKLEFVYTDTCPDPSRRGKLLSDADMAYVAAVFDIDYNADLLGDWVRFEQEDKSDSIQHFYYRHTLKRNAPGTGETTKPLFTRLAVDRRIGNEQYSHIQKIGGFDLRITGHVIQQMTGETHFGLNSAEDACRAGLFDF